MDQQNKNQMLQKETASPKPSQRQPQRDDMEGSDGDGDVDMDAKSEADDDDTYQRLALGDDSNGTSVGDLSEISPLRDVVFQTWAG
jgi:hypothetical protein